jgi:hypothetical protein
VDKGKHKRPQTYNFTTIAHPPTLQSPTTHLNSTPLPKVLHSTNMARTKAPPNQSPSFLYSADRDLPRILAGTATTLTLQAKLLRVSHSYELVVPTTPIRPHFPLALRSLEIADPSLLNQPAKLRSRDTAVNK